MLYVIVRNRETEDADVCIVKASNNEQAKRMVGVEEGHTDWVAISDQHVDTVVSSQEGYIAKKL